MPPSQYPQVFASFVDEFVKLAKAEQYKLPIVAHEMGHARISEKSLLPPSVRKQLRRIATIVPPTAVMPLSLAKSGGPVAAGVSLLADAPKLIEEGRATAKGLKALKAEGKISQKEYDQSKSYMKKAFNGYVADSLSRAGIYGSLGSLSKIGPAAIPLAMASLGAGFVADRAIKKSMLRQEKDLPYGDMPRLERLKQRMGVTAGITPLKFSAEVEKKIPKAQRGAMGFYIMPGKDDARTRTILMNATELSPKQQTEAMKKGTILV